VQNIVSDLRLFQQIYESKNMQKKIIPLSRVTAFLLLIILLAISSCATSKKSATLGGVIGGTTGAIMGGISYPGRHGKHRTRNIIVGATMGAAAGIIAGKLFGNEVEKEKKKAFGKGKEVAPHARMGAIPSLNNPQVETRWVEGRIIGNRYVDGHLEYIIVEPARWEEQ
jgi:Na+/proline symporter